MATALYNTIQQDENLETYCLIWLDASVNESQENIQAQKQLRLSINYLIPFEDDQRCLQYIKSTSKDDRIIFIVSGRLGQIILPQIVKYRQITSIYVYCMNRQANERWANQFSKVKAVIVELNELIRRIETDQHQRMYNKIDESLPICIINANDGDHGQSTTDLSGNFLQSQLLVDCLIKMKPDADDENELISLCKQQYQGNANELKIIEEFEREYSSDRALWWYTRNSFLYQMLNKALRVQNIHLLFLFRFVIHDIEQQLEENRCLSPVRVYRAQLMSDDEVQMLKDSLGEFIGINSFFSTSLDPQRARSFFLSNHNSSGVQRVFFEIEADPQLDGIKPFSDISSYSYYPEEEVLFMTGSIFRLANIHRDKDGILTIRMTLCSLNNHHLGVLYQHMQKKPQNREVQITDFADMLKRMGKWDDAEKYYHRFLNARSIGIETVATCYCGLGSIAKHQDDYESSLKWHNESLKIKMRTLKPDAVSIGRSHQSMGHVYLEKREYARALESFEKALEISEKAFGVDHINTANYLDDIGTVYLREQKYLEALEIYQKVLSIREKHLPANHVDLGISHQCIGIVYKALNDYDLALSHYNLSLKIYRRSLSSDHPSIAKTLRGIGLVYKDKGDFQQALPYFEKAAAMLRPLLISNTS